MEYIAVVNMLDDIILKSATLLHTERKFVLVLQPKRKSIYN